MKIVGIDPGLGRIGYAAINGTPRGVELLCAETITTPPGERRAGRLAALEQALTDRLKRDRPDGVSIERIFFEKNRKTALAVAEARGVILLTASRHVHSIWEYTPLEVKLAVAGHGRAAKADVRRMLRILLPHATIAPGDDTADAVAIALTAFYTHRIRYGKLTQTKGRERETF